MVDWKSNDLIKWLVPAILSWYSLYETCLIMKCFWPLEFRWHFIMHSNYRWHYWKCNSIKICIDFNTNIPVNEIIYKPCRMVFKLIKYLGIDQLTRQPKRSESYLQISIRFRSLKIGVPKILTQYLWFQVSLWINCWLCWSVCLPLAMLPSSIALHQPLYHQWFQASFQRLFRKPKSLTGKLTRYNTTSNEGANYSFHKFSNIFLN